MKIKGNPTSENVNIWEILFLNLEKPQVSEEKNKTLTNENEEHKIKKEEIAHLYSSM
jgi:hypothetical protein